MAAGRTLHERWADVSLRAKITGVTVFILFLGLIVAGVGTLSLLQPGLIGVQDGELRQLYNDPRPALAPGASTDALTRDDVLYASNQYYVAVLDADGSINADNSRVTHNTNLPDIPPLTIGQIRLDVGMLILFFGVSFLLQLLLVLGAR